MAPLRCHTAHVYVFSVFVLCVLNELIYVVYVASNHLFVKILGVYMFTLTLIAEGRFYYIFGAPWCGMAPLRCHTALVYVFGCLFVCLFVCVF